MISMEIMVVMMKVKEPSALIRMSMMTMLTTQMCRIIIRWIPLGIIKFNIMHSMNQLHAFMTEVLTGMLLKEMIFQLGIQGVGHKTFNFRYYTKHVAEKLKN